MKAQRCIYYMLAIMVLAAAIAGCGNAGTATSTTDIDGSGSSSSSGSTSSTTGITSDSGTAGATPSTTTVVQWDGYPTTITQPTITSLVANSTYTMSTAGNTNFPSGSVTLVATFDETMLTDQLISQENITLACTGSDTIVASSVSYTSNTTMQIVVNNVPTGNTCNLTFAAPSGNEDTRDYAHNPFAGAIYPITTSCSIDDSFSNLDCWTALNTSSGTFSASSGTLSFSMANGNSANLSNAPAIRKTGLAFKTLGVYVPYISPSIIVSSFTNFPSGNSTDLVGVRVVDGSNYFACTVGNGKLVETDSTNGSTTASFTVPSGSIHVVPSIYGSGGFFTQSECKVVDDLANELAKITVNYLSGQTNLSLDILGVGNASSGAIGATVTSYNPINMVVQ